MLTVTVQKFHVIVLSKRVFCVGVVRKNAECLVYTHQRRERCHIKCIDFFLNFLVFVCVRVKNDDPPELLSANPPLPIIGESDILPTLCTVMPPVDVAQARFPLRSSATAPTVSCSLLIIAQHHKRS